MLIDTHCHLDATEFDDDRVTLINEAWQTGIDAIVIPAVMESNFAQIQTLCAEQARCFYALGWHPMYVDFAPDDALVNLHSQIQALLNNPNSASQLVAIGEIGLDFFVTRNHQHLDDVQAHQAKQTDLFVAQLKLAQHFDLPVILHVRGAIDSILKHLRRYPVRGGIAHAFNGSLQQAQMFIELGLKLGFGGAMTYPRATKIRALAEQLPLEAIVLETDAPDIPPVWLGHHVRNTPSQLQKIAQELAAIKRIPVSQIVEITGKNSMQVFPKIAHLYTPVKVIH